MNCVNACCDAAVRIGRRGSRQLPTQRRQSGVAGRASVLGGTGKAASRSASNEMMPRRCSLRCGRPVVGRFVAPAFQVQFQAGGAPERSRMPTTEGGARRVVRLSRALFSLMSCSAVEKGRQCAATGLRGEAGGAPKQ